MAAPPPDVPVIRAGNGACTVWQRFRFTRSIEHLPSIVFFEASERIQTFNEAVLAPFTPCTAWIGADKILTGYCDVVEPRVEKRSHEISMAIRSKTSDLVDCSVDVDALAAGTGSWAITAGTVGSAAKLITSPYGIGVQSIEDVSLNTAYPIPVPPGATCWQILEELARVTQRLIYDAPDGSLVISPVGTARAACGLSQGVNLEFGAARLSSDQRYSKVVVFSQDTFNDSHGAPYLAFKQIATDNGVPRNRLLMIPTDLPGPNGLYAQQRADWEVARRYGRSREVQITVTGFRDSAGALWEVNTVVNIRAPALKISGEDMVIARVEFVLDERGSRTTLTCMPPAGLAPAPFVFRPPFTISQADARRAAAGQRCDMSGEVPSPDIHWGAYDQLQRNAARSRNSLAGVTLNLPDDSGPVQKFQTEGHVGELRTDVARVENHGFSSLPLVGAKGIAIYLGGDRGNGIVVATVDARYRPTGLHPGESQLYIVDGAQKDGTGGTTRTILQGLLGWVAKLFGVTILVGDGNTQNVTITASSLIKLAGNVEITGNLTVDGKTSVQDIAIAGSESGGGPA